MSTTNLNLRRATYLTAGQSQNGLDWLSAKYLNIRFALQPYSSMVVDASNVANPFGIAFQVYGDRDYWWVVCAYNGIIHPVEDIQIGTVLQFPRIDDVNAMLASQSSNDLSVTVL